MPENGEIVEKRKEEMKMRKKIVGLILLLTLMMSVPVMGANASWGPDEDDYRTAVIEYMVDNHSEDLEGLETTEWNFTMTDERWWFIRYKGVDVNGTGEEYELEWSGGAKWVYFTILVWEESYRYQDYWDINVTKVGPGTTVNKPGMYYVKPGDDYTFRAKPSASDDDEITFVFRHWNVTNGESWWIETESVLTGEATQNLWITAVFRTRYYSGTRIVYEDGLSAGYMWRDDHVLVAVRAVGSSAITITIDGDYGTFSNTWNTGVRSFCVYFRPYWFTGEYTLTVTAVNGSPYLPSYIVGGLD